MPITSNSPATREPRARGYGVTAVLGPTNTGKTHLAIERMLAHSSGMIGLPLRLLAREVYNKVVDRVGADAVALVTGEEKIKPANPRFWVSTAEAMPRDLDVAFLAVDEVQLGTDLERGHVYTDRMLHLRGREETLVLGAATVRPMIDKLLPGANVISRPRLSQLAFAGEKKITRLPRRTAIVAFSADEVYAVAELIRRQRGGAAVVLGALSPRTRNAQVALFQSGDVDYLIATDAIGMGLNLDVDHVAFASDRKFDGYQFRRLSPAEFAQIAGRAGRATRDGTFGTTGRCPPFEPELVQALESHAFEPIRVLQWRNTDLDYSSLGALSASLAVVPNEQGLTRAPLAEDILVFDHAVRDEDIRSMVKSPAAVERLWEICQIPDYRKISPAAHAELVVTLFGFLMREGKISSDWFARQVAQADRTDGDLDTLSTRIAHIRTWTFAANRPDWLADPEHWQNVTRAVEDKLSDALHERLTERFVDRRTSVLMRRLRENTMLETEITKTGDVIVEGHAIGRLEGFRFAPASTAGTSDAKALSAAAQKALAGEIEARASRIAHAPDSQFLLASDGTIRWIGEAVARLVAGDNVLRPRVRILSDEHLTGAAHESVQTRLDLWTRTHIERLLAPLFVLGAAEDVTGIARGIAYQIVEALGVLERQKVGEEVKGLDQPARATLRKHGVRFGAYHLYVPALLKPGPRALAAQLWAIKHGGPDLKGLDDLQRLAASGRTSFATDKEVQKSLYRTIGYRVCGERAVRVDILERLADLIRPAITWRDGAPGQKPAGAFGGGSFIVTQSMTSLTGSSGEDFASILRALGYRMEKRPKPQEAQAQAEPIHESQVPHEAGAPVVDTAVVESGAGAQAIEAAISHATTIIPAEQIIADGSVVPESDGLGLAMLEPVVRGVPAETEIVGINGGEGAGAEIRATEIQATDIQATKIQAAEIQAAEIQVTDVQPGCIEATGISIDKMPTGVSTAPENPGSSAPPTDAKPEKAENQLIEVWRPGRSEERRGPRRHRRAGERQAPAAEVATEASRSVASAGEAASGDAAPPAHAKVSETDAPHVRKGRRRRPDQRHQPEGERPQRSQRSEGSPRPEKARPEKFARPERGRRREEDRPPRTWGSANERRNKEPDPNSPFAKLAALKAQLEANAKESH
jgi:ATP-dependent RNA helicase SUPV3L1/SUV3